MIQQQDRNRRFDLRQLKVHSPGEGTSGQCFVGMDLGFLVPGVVTTPIGALSNPAAMAARIRSQNASSMSK